LLYYLGWVENGWYLRLFFAGSTPARRYKTPFERAASYQKIVIFVGYNQTSESGGPSARRSRRCGMACILLRRTGILLRRTVAIDY
jgi:hypothetical protein